MAYEFFLCSGCPLQQRLGPAGLMRAAKIKETLEWINEQHQKWDGRGIDPEERTMVFQYEIDTPAGPQSVLSVRELREAYEILIASEAYDACGDCALNLRRDLLGCYGSIKYPISPAAEEWLMNRFDPPDGPDGYIPHHLASGGVTGQALDKGRPRRGEPPQGLLAAPTPAVARLQPHGPEITSSQIIEYLLACMPEMRPITMFGLCVDFHAVELAEEERLELNNDFSLECRIGRELVREEMGDFRHKLKHVPFRIPFDPDADPSIQQFILFFMTCWAGCRADTGMAVDG